MTGFTVHDISIITLPDKDILSRLIFASYLYQNRKRYVTRSTLKKR